MLYISTSFWEGRFVFSKKAEKMRKKQEICSKILQITFLPLKTLKSQTIICWKLKFGNHKTLSFWQFKDPAFSVMPTSYLGL